MYLEMSRYWIHNYEFTALQIKLTMSKYKIESTTLLHGCATCIETIPQTDRLVWNTHGGLRIHCLFQKSIKRMVMVYGFLRCDVRAPNGTLVVLYSKFYFVQAKVIFLNKNEFRLTKFITYYKFCVTKVNYVSQNWILWDKFNFVSQKSILCDKSLFCVTKLNFVRKLVYKLILWICKFEIEFFFSVSLYLYPTGSKSQDFCDLIVRATKSSWDSRCKETKYL